MSDFEKLKEEYKNKLIKAQSVKEVNDIRSEIFGKKGMLISGNKRKYNFFIDRYKIAYKLQLNDLYNLVTKNKKPRSTFDDGEKSLCIANAAFKSLKLKKIVTI